METFKDLLFRYCVIFGKRFSAKDKIAFLRVITKELMQLNYYVDAKLAKLALTNKKYQNYYNAYIGDLNKAELIICTHYDTGVNNFNLLKTHAFEQQFSKLSYFIGLSPMIILFLLSLLLNYFIFIPDIQHLGFFSFSGISSVLSTVLLFYFILKYKNGIPNKKNFVCNTSSIITIINLIKKLDKKAKKKIAFVLYDGGCTSLYGIKMLENYSDKIKHKKIIFLDSIGNDENLLFFKPNQANFTLDGVEFHEGKIEANFKNYMMITSGQLDKDNKVCIKNAYCRKDNHLSYSTIEQHTEALYNVCHSLISSKHNSDTADTVINKVSN